MGYDSDLDLDFDCEDDDLFFVRVDVEDEDEFVLRRKMKVMENCLKGVFVKVFVMEKNDWWKYLEMLMGDDYFWNVKYDSIFESSLLYWFVDWKIFCFRCYKLVFEKFLGLCWNCEKIIKDDFLRKDYV